MSTSVSSSLSAGAQILQNDGLLPSNLSQSDLANATPAQLAKLAGAQMAVETTADLFGQNTSATGDTVDLSQEAMDSLFQQNAQPTGASSATSTDANTVQSSVAALNSALLSSLSSPSTTAGTVDLLG